MILEAIARRLKLRRILRENNTDYLDRYSVRGYSPGSENGHRAYLHHFLSHDEDGHHNHPWRWSFSIVLRGGYAEERLDIETGDTWRETHMAGAAQRQRVGVLDARSRTRAVEDQATGARVRRMKTPVCWNALCFVHLSSDDMNDRYSTETGDSRLVHQRSSGMWLASLRGTTGTTGTSCREASEPAWQIPDSVVARRALDAALAALRIRVASDTVWLAALDEEIGE